MEEQGKGWTLPISHWTDSDRRTCFTEEALLEKLTVLDEIDMEHIRIVVNSDSKNAAEMRLLVLKNTIGLLKATLDPAIDTDWRVSKRETETTIRDCGFVYIASCDTPNIYKIGKANDLDNRERTLRVGNIYLKMFAYTMSTNPLGLEKLLHALYKTKRVSGEWFELEDRDIGELVENFGFTIALAEVKK